MIIVALTHSPAFGQEQAEKDYETAMTQGSFRLDAGEYAAAVADFKQALAIKPSDKAALISLGIAYSRSEDLRNARETLQRVVDADAADSRARYELGVVLFKLDDREGAKQQFTAASAGSADDSLKEAAREYLDVIASGGAEKKRYSLSILAGEQHDSNVILDPDNPLVAAQRKADWRFIAQLSGSYKVVDEDKGFLEAGYSLYDGHNSALTEFNVRQHTLSLAGRYGISEEGRLDLRYAYQYSLVGGNKYGGTHTIRPSAAFSFTKASVTELYYAYGKKTFYDGELFPENSDRDGKNNAAGLTHTIILGKQTAISAGYAYDKDSTEKSFWDYTGNKGLLTFQSSLFDTGIVLTGSYYDRKYGGAPAGISELRHDKTGEYSLSLSRPLTKNFRLELSDLYVRNKSNLSPYEYTRNIVGLMAVMHL